MTQLRSRTGTIVVTVVLGVIVMLLVQRTFLVIPLVSSVPAAVVAGLFAAGARPHDTPLTRFGTAGSSAALTAVVVGLWMSPATPSGRVLQVVLGWVVVAILLTVVHGVLALGSSRVLARTRRDPAGRLR
ncbi:hypothetical protein [Janibacter corallicola]|uniref:hypothetical protein n=1 Tax=Janibacter corallicola TaxID=415212 RepID=UPI000AC05A0B|nr:hypothetical protein [Janibacter corallicola]